MNLLTGGSILAAFFAGSVALFAPCCIVFLLPAYLASALKERRWALFPLTLVFAAGLALIILPLTLGVGLLASTLTRFHRPLYITGGLLMIALGAFAISGRSLAMPKLRSPALRTDVPGVFGLGVFSGIASSCCAPVLAGVLALSALSGSLPGSVALGLAYVFGMVFPLLLIALLWDRLRLGERKLVVGRPLTLRLLGSTLRTTTTNVIAGTTFLAMGAFVIVLGVTGDTTAAPGIQVGFGRWLTRVFGSTLGVLENVPEAVLGLGLLALAVLIAFIGARGAARAGRAHAASCHDTGAAHGSTEGESCHEHQDRQEHEPERAGAPANP